MDKFATCLVCFGNAYYISFKFIFNQSILQTCLLLLLVTFYSLLPFIIYYYIISVRYLFNYYYKS